MAIRRFSLTWNQIEGLIKKVWKQLLLRGDKIEWVLRSGSDVSICHLHSSRQWSRHFFRPALHRDLPEGGPEDYHTWSAPTRGADYDYDGDNHDEKGDFDFKTPTRNVRPTRPTVLSVAWLCSELLLYSKMELIFENMLAWNIFDCIEWSEDGPWASFKALNTHKSSLTSTKVSFCMKPFQTDIPPFFHLGLEF